MRILILNWRDIKNPAGGGAELLTHELATRWVNRGHQVTQLCAAYKNAKAEEVIDGVHFIRKGRWWNIQIIALFYYLRVLRETTDIIVDEVHWFPFFSALYARKKTVALVCEVATKLFFRIFPSIVAACFVAVEKVYFKIYKSIPMMAISPSTAADLVKEGHNKKDLIILPMGLSVPKGIKPEDKEKVWTIIYLARLNKQKGILDAITAFSLIKKQLPDCKFWVVGSGEESYVAMVKEKVKEYDLTESVKFFGFVSVNEKYTLLSKAHLLISASTQEGWGLTVHEAGFVGTPAVVYNVLGLRDTIVNNKTGILVDPDPESLAKGVVALLNNQKKYTQIRKAMLEEAKQYNWDNAAIMSLALFEKVLREQ